MILFLFNNSKGSDNDDANEVTPKPPRRIFTFKRKDKLPSHAPRRTSENVTSDNGKIH